MLVCVELAQMAICRSILSTHEMIIFCYLNEDDTITLSVSKLFQKTCLLTAQMDVCCKTCLPFIVCSLLLLADGQTQGQHTN